MSNPLFSEQLFAQPSAPQQTILAAAAQQLPALIAALQSALAQAENQQAQAQQASQAAAAASQVFTAQAQQQQAATQSNPAAQSAAAQQAQSAAAQQAQSAAAQQAQQAAAQASSSQAAATQATAIAKALAQQAMAAAQALAAQAAFAAPAPWAGPAFSPAQPQPLQLQQAAALGSANANAPSCQTPPVDIAENSESFSLQADMPGASDQNVEVYYRDGVLNIRGRSDQESSDADSDSKSPRQPLMKERRPTIYQRAIPLGMEIEEESITASVNNGVLHVNLPKTKQGKKSANMRRISVASNNKAAA